MQTLCINNSFKEFCYKLKEIKAVGPEGGSGAKTIFLKGKKLNLMFYANLVDRKNLVTQGRQGKKRACP